MYKEEIYQVMAIVLLLVILLVGAGVAMYKSDKKTAMRRRHCVEYCPDKYQVQCINDVWQEWQILEYCQEKNK